MTSLCQVTITAVVAVTHSWGIGYQKAIPWAIQGIRLERDMEYFRRCTKDTDEESKYNAVVMGRVTWESIPEGNRPLKNRICIVITSKDEAEICPHNSQFLHFKSVNCVYAATSLDAAMRLVETDSLSSVVSKSVVIGGSQLFEEALLHPQFKTLHLTEVLSPDFPCDTFLTPRSIDYIKSKRHKLSLIRDQLQEENVIYRFVGTVSSLSGFSFHYIHALLNIESWNIMLRQRLSSCWVGKVIE